MSEKLDPRLAELVEQAETESGDRAVTLDVLVGLDVPLDATSRAELSALGLGVRSEIGTVLTGTISVADVRRLATSPRVVKVEASAPLFRERGEGGQ